MDYCTQVCRQALPTPLRPPHVHLDIIHMIGVPSLFAALLLVYYTEHKPKNKKQGRPGNEANCYLHRPNQEYHTKSHVYVHR